MSRNLFSTEALRGVVRTGDLRQFRIPDDQLAAVVEAASVSIVAGQATLSNFHIARIKNRNCVCYTDFDVHLLLRSIALHLRRRFRVSAPGRDQVIRGLIEATLDATPGYLLRRDIRSFYETLPTSQLRRRLADDTTTPPQIREYLEKFFASHCFAPAGIPRGTPISPLLADIAMQEFDEAIRSNPGVFRYYRFADDIIALTTNSAENLEKFMEDRLPQPMRFNLKKSRNVVLGCKSKMPFVSVEFEYLGYHFNVAQTKAKHDSRIVKVALSKTKVHRLKSRIALAFKTHSIRPDWALLLDRMRFLTSNHRLLRTHVTSTKDSPYIKSGLYYNYRACGEYRFSNGKFVEDLYDRKELKDVDGFYYSLLRKITKNVVLPGNQIVELKRLSFHRSFELKIHWNFEPTRMAVIKSCWRNM